MVCFIDWRLNTGVTADVAFPPSFPPWERATGAADLALLDWILLLNAIKKASTHYI